MAPVGKPPAGPKEKDAFIPLFVRGAEVTANCHGRVMNGRQSVCVCGEGSHTPSGAITLKGGDWKKEKKKNPQT